MSSSDNSPNEEDPRSPSSRKNKPNISKQLGSISIKESNSSNKYQHGNTEKGRTKTQKSLRKGQESAEYQKEHEKRKTMKQQQPEPIYFKLQHYQNLTKILKTSQKSEPENIIDQQKLEQNYDLSKMSQKQKDDLIKKFLTQRSKDIIIRKFYSRNFYSVSNYTQLLKQYSNINNPKFNHSKNSTFVSNITRILFKIYSNKLNQVINKQSGYDGFILVKVWQYWSKFYFELMDNQLINWSKFMLRNQDNQYNLRVLFLTMSLEDSIQIYKKYTKSFNRKQQFQKLKLQEIHSSQKDPDNFLVLSALSIKKSFIYQNKPLKNKIYELVEKVKNSLFLKQIFEEYFTLLMQMEDQFKQKVVQVNGNKIFQKMKNTNVSFIDYGVTSICGVTYTHSQQYPIYINLFRFHPKIFYAKHQTILSYILFTLIHEMVHYLLRGIQLVEGQDDSNPWNKKNIHGGYQFQHYLFGGKVNYCTQDDYTKFQKLLSFQDQLKIQSIIQYNCHQRRQKFIDNYKMRKQNYQKDHATQKGDTQKQTKLTINQEEFKEYLEKQRNNIEEEIKNFNEILQQKAKKPPGIKNQQMNKESNIIDSEQANLQKKQAICSQQEYEYEQEENQEYDFEENQEFGQRQGQGQGQEQKEKIQEYECEQEEIQEKKQKQKYAKHIQELRSLFSELQQVGLRNQINIKDLIRKGSQFIKIREEGKQILEIGYCAVKGSILNWQ